MDEIIQGGTKYVAWRGSIKPPLRFRLNEENYCFIYLQMLK